MTKRSTSNRLERLEAKRAGPTPRVCCVAIGDNPPMRPDGSKCEIDHKTAYTIGGMAVRAVWSDAVATGAT